MFWKRLTQASSNSLFIVKNDHSFTSKHPKPANGLKFNPTFDIPILCPFQNIRSFHLMGDCLSCFRTSNPRKIVHVMCVLPEIPNLLPNLPGPKPGVHRQSRGYSVAAVFSCRLPICIRAIEHKARRLPTREPETTPVCSPRAWLGFAGCNCFEGPDGGWPEG